MKPVFIKVTSVEGKSGEINANRIFYIKSNDNGTTNLYFDEETTRFWVVSESITEIKSRIKLENL